MGVNNRPSVFAVLKPLGGLWKAKQDSDLRVASVSCAIPTQFPWLGYKDSIQFGKTEMLWASISDFRNKIISTKKKKGAKMFTRKCWTHSKDKKQCFLFISPSFIYSTNTSWVSAICQACVWCCGYSYQDKQAFCLLGMHSSRSVNSRFRAPGSESSKEREHA